MQNFLKRLESHREHLSQLEEQVLDYILMNPNQIVKMTLSSFSKEIFVSTATVSRTCKQFGYKGFQDFKYSFSKHLDTPSATEYTSSLNLLNTHINRMKEELEETLALINEDDMLKAVQMIKKARQVEFFGVGASYPTCVDAARKLLFSGKICNAREDWDTLYSIAENLTSEDVAILVSYSGETNQMLEFSSLLAQRQVKIISIVGHKNSSMEVVSTITLIAKVINCYYGHVDMSSRFPLTIVLDLLILTYMNET